MTSETPKPAMVIDATDLKLGRLAARAAKSALQGEEVVIVNSGKAVVTGNKDTLFREYKKKRDLRTRYKGPYFPRRPDRIMKRTIRGMLPYKKETGKNALNRVKTYIGVPPEFESVEKMHIQEAEITNLPSRKYSKLEEIAKSMGYKE